MAAANAAILYEPGSYDGAQKQLKGRHVAGASFLDGFVRYADVDEFVAITFRQEVHDVFRRKIRDVQDTFRPERRPSARAVTLDRTAEIAEMGVFYCPDPTIGRFAWDRRFAGQRAYSFCGLTHTVSSKGVMQSLADYLTAPLQPWDALICTSTAVRDVVRGVHEEYGAYLEARSGARPPQPVQMPVIPLGLDVDAFAARGRDGAARKALRDRLGIAEDDVVALFLGRLAFHAKAHSSPMYAAMQRAQEQLAGEGRRLHMLMTGQFPNPGAEAGYRKAAALVCPDVPVHFVDGTPGPESWSSWAAADLFLSLSDNIQESFGITPIEAMAAGLPCVVSDWDGYKDTVVDGETGYRIRTTMAMPGAGITLARAFSGDRLSYDRYIGGACLITSVDVDATAAALARLARDVDLRRRMGQAGTDRARALYDWSVIIPQYQALWGELNARRRSGSEIAPPPPFAANPVIPDPMVAFRAYPSDHATVDTRVEAATTRTRALAIFDDDTAMFLPELLLPRDSAMALFDAAAATPGARFGDLLATVEPARRSNAARTLMWFAKFGALRLLPTESSETMTGKTEP
jgi:glycosyltransferase involved in cell wall biosynthesis